MFTDEQYLDYLCKTEKNVEFDNAMLELMRLDLLQQADLGIIDRSSLDGVNIQELQTQLMMGFDPSNIYKFRNEYLDKLKRTALSHVDEDANLRTVPVGTLSTPDLNACAIRNPDGGPIILLNIGLSDILSIFLQSFFGFYYWQTEEPYSRDHTQREFKEAMLATARFATSGDRAFITPVAKTLLCPSRPYMDKFLSDRVFGCELFVLLHEYGHILLGHLDPQNTRVMVKENDIVYEIYNNSQRQEFEADEFAFKKLIPICSAVYEAQFYAGLVMKFFALCEHVGGLDNTAPSSHPPASKRWEAINQTAINEDSSQASDLCGLSLDSVFCHIMQT